jgi:hypothetical protein
VKDLNPPFGAADKHSEFFARKSTKNTGKRTSGKQGAGTKGEGRGMRDSSFTVAPDKSGLLRRMGDGRQKVKSA